uniref:Nitric oxide synthase-interacting protein zinc-finger domain-containing protein n=1 Tax=Strigamia maritima TaxID=126957 RepID=T1IZZ3_STRMM
MTRHAKNCTAGAVYTYHEKRKDTRASGYGTQAMRLGKDAVKDFDCCSLSLQPCRNPMLTPNGIIYDKEAIFEYIIAQKTEYARKMKEYEKQKNKEKNELAELAMAERESRVKKFVEKERNILSTPHDPFTTGKVEKESISNMAGGKNKSLPSFWIPTLTPQAKTTELKKPDKTIYCPMTGKPLKAKELIPVIFTPIVDPDDKSSLIVKKNRYMCAVTHDILGNTVPCAVLKTSGNVVTVECVEKLIKKDMLDPINGKKLTEKDIICLQMLTFASAQSLHVTHKPKVLSGILLNNSRKRGRYISKMESKDKLENLYKNYDILADAKDKIGEHEKEYLEILKAAKDSTREKLLASQIISRFFKYFPSVSNQAIDAQLDLCEDEDVAIRKQAIKDLPTLCRDNTENLPKIADVLAQLLQTEDNGELTAVHISLMTLFRIDCKGTLGGIFLQIITGEEVVRERAIKFLASKLKTLSEDVFTEEIELFFLDECKKVLQDVTADEFILFMNMMGNLKISRTVSGQQQIVQIIEDICELERDFVADDSETVDRFVQCVRHVLPYFSSQISSTKFVNYLCGKVLPVAHTLHSNDEGIDMHLEILKLLAEMSTFTGSLENSNQIMNNICTKLLDYMPLPPCDETTENSTPNDEPKLEFSYVECFMHVFHQIGKRHSDWLIAEERSELLKDFRLRLQYFARGSQAYAKKLREALLGKRGDELKSDENKIKVVALKTTSNINTLIKDLFHNPPSYKSNIGLSWKPAAATTVPKQFHTTVLPLTSPSAKRKTPITYNDGPSKKFVGGSKQDREIYIPPSGKYSNKVKHFAVPRGLGALRRGRGLTRGRGRGI